MKSAPGVNKIKPKILLAIIEASISRFFGTKKIQMKLLIRRMVQGVFVRKIIKIIEQMAIKIHIIPKGKKSDCRKKNPKTKKKVHQAPRRISVGFNLEKPR